MGKLDKRYNMVEDVNNIILEFKSGRSSLYRDINLIEVYKDEIGIKWLVIYWETKSKRDTIRILLNTLDEIKYVEDLSKFADQRKNLLLKD